MLMKYLLLIILMLTIIPIVTAIDSCDLSETCEIPEPENLTIQQENVLNKHAEDSLCMVYFYGDGCAKCSETEKLLEEIENKYGDQIYIEKLELYHNLKNYQMYNEYCGLQNIPLNQRGVPLMLVNDEYFMGASSIKENLEKEIDGLLKSGDFHCPLDGQMNCHNVQGNGDSNPINPDFKEEKVTWALVLFTGLIDGVNPCAFAVLIFLLTFLVSVSSNRKRMMKAGTAYIFSVYVVYFLAGLGIFSVIQLSGASSLIVKIAAIVAILAGLINIKDYFWYGKGFSLAIPESKKKIIEAWTYKANIPAAIVLGFLVSMFELPCTGGVYLAILAMLASTVTKMQAVIYLLVYNAMFVLPLLVILYAVRYGMKAEHIENFRNSKKKTMRLVLGLILVLLGLGLLLGWF